MTSVSASFPFRIVAAGLADIGRVRKHNEDTILLREDLNLFLLADGAGGHEAGNVASALATTTVAHHFESTKKLYLETPYFDSFGLPAAARRLSAALHRANHEVLEVAVATNKRKGMGTTIVAAWLDARSGLFHVGHVGDSRCYRLRGRHLELLTQDHSLATEVLEMQPELDETVLAKLPRHVVTRALGMAESVRTTLRSFEPAPGDKYLLCSDGLHGAVPDAQIAEALAIERTPEEQARLLIAMAKDAGSRDNISAVVIDCDPIPDILHAPRPSSERPRSSTPMYVELDDTGPEIVVLDDLNETDEVPVIPADTGSPSMRTAIAGFVGPMRPKR
jgi:serine/threonine protein phosphatase PrpC